MSQAFFDSYGNLVRFPARCLSSCSHSLFFSFYSATLICANYLFWLKTPELFFLKSSVVDVSMVRKCHKLSSIHMVIQSDFQHVALLPVPIFLFFSFYSVTWPLKHSHAHIPQSIHKKLFHFYSTNHICSLLTFSFILRLLFGYFRPCLVLLPTPVSLNGIWC